MIYPTAIGSFIVSKGLKQSWTINIKQRSALIGIMDEDMIQKSGNAIEDFTDAMFGGYGLSTHSWQYYHSAGYSPTGSLIKYSEQFKADGKSVVVTMELDMTQKEDKNAILTYINHNETKEYVKEMRTDGEFTNIAWNDIDFNKKCRLAVAGSYSTDYETEYKMLNNVISVCSDRMQL